MGRKQVHMLLDECIWTQFQALYPRQATKSFEDMMSNMINLKLEITDEQGEQMKAERDQLKETSDRILNQIKEHDMKVKAWESRRRDEMLKQKKELGESYKQASVQGKAIRASGILEKVRIQ